jgi:phage terminase small subunit
MNEKQKRFCDKYLIDFNGRRSYKAVYGVGDNSAEAGASRLLRNVKVKAYIAETAKEATKDVKVSRERVLDELAAIAFADNDKLEEGNIASSFEVSIGGFAGKVVKRKIDKLKALEMLGKYFKLFEGPEISNESEQQKDVLSMTDEEATRYYLDRVK